MKLFSSKKKIAIIGTMLTTMLAGTIAYAATPIKQDAYYDTFKLFTNGSEQFISDTALKPFIANGRVYVPIATLQNLGIANVQWSPAATGQSATLTVSPKGGMDTSQVAVYQQQIAALTASITTKDNEIKTLKAEKESLEAQVDKYKNSSSSSSGDLSTRDLQALEDILNDDRDFEEFYVDSTIRDIGFTYEVDEYRGDVEINMYPTTEITSSILSTLKTDSVARSFDSFIEDIGEEAERKFKDSDVIINLYDDRERNRPSEIHSFDYDGRLRDTIKDAK